MLGGGGDGKGVTGEEESGSAAVIGLGALIVNSLSSPLCFCLGDTCVASFSLPLPLGEKGSSSSFRLMDTCIVVVFEEPSCDFSVCACCACWQCSVISASSAAVMELW